MKKNILNLYENFLDITSDLDKLNSNKNDEFGEVNSSIYDEHDYILSLDKNPEFFKDLCEMCEDYFPNLPSNKNGFTQEDLNQITYIDSTFNKGSYFEDVTSLDELKYFHNLKIIHSYSLNCPNLKMVNLNIKNIFIYNYAFSFCTSLKEIIIPIKFKNDMHDIFYGIDLTKVNITYI